MMPIEMRLDFTPEERKQFPRAMFVDFMPTEGDIEAVKRHATPLLKPIAEHVKRGGHLFWPMLGFGDEPEIKAWYQRCFMRLLELDVLAESAKVAAQKEKR